MSSASQDLFSLLVVFPILKKENPCISNKSHSTIGLILEYNYGPMVGKISHVWVSQN